MLCTGSEDKIENYKDYRNRVMTKHKEKIKNQLQGLKAQSLKGEDKRKVIADLIEQINNFKL